VSLEAQSIDWPGAEPCPTSPVKVVRNSSHTSTLSYSSDNAFNKIDIFRDP